MGDPTDSIPTRLATTRVYDGRVVKVDVDTVQGPAGDPFPLEIIRHPGAAAILPVLSDLSSDDPTILLIRQFRHAAGGAIWEIPAGVLEPNEDPAACAHRELLEETGARAGRMEHLTTIYTTPGFTNERIHLFLATDLTVGEPSHEADEFIRVEARQLGDALAMVRDGEITDGKTVAALLYAAGFRLGL